MPKRSRQEKQKPLNLNLQINHCRAIISSIDRIRKEIVASELERDDQSAIIQQLDHARAYASRALKLVLSIR